MRKYLSILCIIVLCCFLFAGCQQKVDNPDVTIPTTQTTPTEKPVETEPVLPEINVPNQSKMEFDTYVLDSAYAQINANTMFSPLSLDMALGIVAEGAGSEYQSLFNKLLGRQNYAEFATEYIKHLQMLNVDESSPYDQYKTVFEIANSVWVNNGCTPTEKFGNKVTSFDAEMNTVDFKDIATTIFKINQWSNEKTHEMIQKIISEDDINANTQAIIVNAVYFESPWVEPWVVSTKDKDFKLLDGAKKEVRIMSTTTSTYYENEYATAFGCQYKNGLTFIGILPKAEGEFALSDLNIQSLIESQTYKYDVFAKMPAFKFDNQISNLKDILINAGYGILFDASMPIFTQMIKNDWGNLDLTISDIIQMDAIELDENGTKAAAVTAIITDGNCAIQPKETKEVVLNRPFAFIIYDSTMNQVVFMGKVVNPEQ